MHRQRHQGLYEKGIGCILYVYVFKTRMKSTKTANQTSSQDQGKVQRLRLYGQNVALEGGRLLRQERMRDSVR